jgi:hypothetical protein
VNCRAGIAAAIALLAATGSLAAERPLTLGMRMNALHASGDMTGGGLTLGVRLSNGWFAAANVDNYRYSPDGVVDTGSSSTPVRLRTLVIGAAIGRQVPGRIDALDWFWSAGIATGLPQAGARDETAAVRSGTQVHLTSAAGGIWRLDTHWSLAAALRVERHYVDIRSSDPESGEPRRLSTLTPAGFYLSLDYRF